MKRSLATCVAILGLWASAAGGFAQYSIQIGEVSAPPGYEAFVPVEVMPGGSLSAANLRIRYDAQVLELLGVAPGAAVPQGSFFDVSEPVDGAVNVLVCPADGAATLATGSGPLLHLWFRVSRLAVAGAEAEVVFGEDDSAPYPFPATGLCDATGAQVAHSRSTGVVRVRRGMVEHPYWMLF